MLNLGFFSDRHFSVAAAAELLGTFGLLGAVFLLTQFLQFVLGLSPLQAGIRILPMAGVLVANAALSPVIARAVGVKLTIAVGLAAIAGALWQISAASTPALPSSALTKSVCSRISLISSIASECVL